MNRNISAGALDFNYLQNHLLDPMSAITHIIGAGFACIGLLLLIDKALDPICPWRLVSYIVFGIALIGLYTASSLYHALKLSEHGSLILQRIDHAMIFVLIAATYTPFCLIPLRGPWGWSIFGTIWLLAICGIIFSVFWINAPRILSTSLYIFMGWIVLICIVPLVRTLQSAALFWLCLGGILYTMGGIIYAVRKPNPWPEVFGFHEIFHCFVMLGSFAHFYAIYRYL